jgi:hypothetical protein
VIGEESINISIYVNFFRQHLPIMSHPQFHPGAWDPEYEAKRTAPARFGDSSAIPVVPLSPVQSAIHRNPGRRITGGKRFLGGFIDDIIREAILAEKVSFGLEPELDTVSRGPAGSIPRSVG